MSQSPAPRLVAHFTMTGAGAALAARGGLAARTRLAAGAALAAALVLAPQISAQNRQIELEWLRSAGAVYGGATAGDNAGSVLAPAGDVNGDGLADMLIGAWSASPGGINDAGTVYLVYGSAQPSPGSALGSLPAAAGAAFHGESFGAQAGWSLAAAGDVNQDGFDDFLIGAPRSQPHGTASGRAYLVWGAASLPAQVDLASLGSLGVTFNGIGDSVNPSLFSDLAGQSVAGPGDVNGDGFDDVLIGASGSSQAGITFAGQSYLVYGSASLPQVFELSALAGGGGMTMNGIAASDQCGYACTAAGDMNGDGYRDFAVGAWQANPASQNDAGSVYLVYGGPALPTVLNFASLGAAGVRINGSLPGKKVGDSLSGGGDVNGDGYDDLLIGNDLGDGPGATQCGGAFLVYGGPALPATLALGSLGAQGVVLVGLDTDDRAGTSVALGGDLNRDGHADLLLGANTADPGGEGSAGESYLVYGAAGLPSNLALATLGVRGVVLAGLDPQDLSGQAAAFVGDVDGDEFGELLLGAPQGDPAGQSNAGEALLVKGAGHFLQAAGPVAEGGSLALRAHGAPGTLYLNMVSIGALPTPVQTSLGPFWLLGHFDLFVGAFAANGESLLTFPMPAPGEFLGLAGLTLHMQVLGQPQGGHNDLSYVLSFVVE